MKAIAHGFAESVKLLLDKGANISRIDNHGWSVFHCALVNFNGLTSSPKILEVLLNQTANNSVVIDIQDKDGRTPLMHAALGNNITACKMLINAGANATIVDKKGLTAFSLVKDNLKEQFAEAVASKVASDHEKWRQKLLLPKEKQSNSKNKNPKVPKLK